MNNRNKPRGRPKKVARTNGLTQEKIDKFAEAMSKRLPKECCAHAAGFSISSLYKWLDKGEQDMEDGVDSMEAKLFESYTELSNQIIEECLTIIQLGAKGWVGSAWILERKYPKLFGRFAPNTPQEPQQKPPIDLSKLSDVDLEKIAASLMKVDNETT